MKPDVLVHFADRIAQVGVYEGLWRRHPEAARLDNTPDGMTVRLDDGTRAYLIGHCKAKPTYTRVRGRWEHGFMTSYVERYLLWTDQGYPILLAVHEHRADALLWRDVRELDRLGRTSLIDGVPHVFFDRDAFTVESCGLVRA